MLANIRSRKEHVSHVRTVRLSTFDRTSQGMMNLLGFIMSLVYMQAVHGWLSTYERLVNSQKFFSPYLTQEDFNRVGSEVKDLFVHYLNDLDTLFMYLSAYYNVKL